MLNGLKIITYLCLMSGFVLAEDSAPEIWSPSPGFAKVANSELWCRSNIERSKSGEYRQSCVFGFRKKGEFDLVEVLRLPKIKGLLYDWKVVKNVLIVRNKENNKVILEMNLQLFKTRGH